MANAEYIELVASRQWVIPSSSAREAAFLKQKENSASAIGDFAGSFDSRSWSEAREICLYRIHSLFCVIDDGRIGLWSMFARAFEGEQPGFFTSFFLPSSI